MKTGLRYAALMGGVAVLSLCAGVASAQVVPNANQYGLNLIGAPAAWAAGYTGQGILVTVADSGIDPNHPAFAGKIDPRSRSFVLNAQGAAFNAADFSDVTAQSHGTHVAGIAAAAGNSQAPGIAFNARILALKMIPSCGKGPDGKDQNCSAPDFPNASASALDYFTAQQDTRIYNASYGPAYDPPGNVTIMPAGFIDGAEAASLRQALAANKIIVAATGNDRENSPIASRNPSGIALDPFIRPANANAGVYANDGSNADFSFLLNQPGIIVAVTSVGAAKTIASYAQLCGVTASWCVAAPGGNPPADAGIWSTLPGNNYGYMSGTSMAAPAVSGALADLMQAYPAYSGSELATVLFATAENVGGQAADNATYGYGLIRLDRAIAGPTTLAAGTTVTVAAQQVNYWSQPLATATFTKAGAGYLIIAGRTTASAPVTLAEGAIGVDGTLTAPTVTVAQGAMLAGFGTIKANVTINGILNAGQLPNYADLIANNGGILPANIPLTGTSPGTLTFQGVETLAATATTRANIDGNLVIPGGPGTWDKIIVTGAGSSFALGGALTPLLRGIPGGNNNYTPAVGSSFVFITAQSGATITGQFASIAQTPAGLAANTRLDVVYNTGSVSLNVTPVGFVQLAAADNLNPNQQAVAGALDGGRPAPGVRAAGKVDTLYDDLYADTAAQDDSALESLSGDGLAATATAMLDGYVGISDALGERQLQWRVGMSGILPAQAGANWTAWASAFGRWASNGASAGLAHDSATGSGMAMGADRWLTPELLLGGALAMAQSDVTSLTAQTRARSYAVAGYATWMPGVFVLDARLAAGPADHRGTRQMAFAGIGTVTGEGDGWGGLASARAGYRIPAGNAVLEPFASLTAQRLENNAYQEDTIFGLAVPHQSFDRVTSDIGLAGSTRFAIDDVTVSPLLQVAWRHDLEDQSRAMQALLLGTPFLIEAGARGRDGAAVNFELSAARSDAISVFAAYNGEFRDHYGSQGVSAGVRVHF